MADLKSLPDISNILFISVVVPGDFFFVIQVVIFLVVDLKSDILLYSGHVGYCVRSLRILFKPFILEGSYVV